MNEKVADDEKQMWQHTIAHSEPEHEGLVPFY
jgi:hypothetical protein